MAILISEENTYCIFFQPCKLLDVLRSIEVYNTIQAKMNSESMHVNRHAFKLFRFSLV